jgi:hypothetical protein
MKRWALWNVIAQPTDLLNFTFGENWIIFTSLEYIHKRSYNSFFTRILPVLNCNFLQFLQFSEASSYVHTKSCNLIYPHQRQ